MQAEAAPLRALRLIDDTGGFFPPRPVEFHAAEIGLDAFGWNIENDRMAEALAAAVAGAPDVERVAAGVEAYEFSAEAVQAQLEGRAGDLGPACRSAPTAGIRRRDAPPASRRASIAIRKPR